ncbi:hypothetical protein ACTQ4M_01160 [Lactobacillus amylovorus]|uniref:hypothetical protein n=1 Tax=Lactobacillus amylovorus TaxID=1604 RepID=UPI003F9917FC
MLYSQEQLDEINRQNEIKELETLAENDPDTIVVYLPDNYEALIGKSADDFANGFKSAVDFLASRLNYYNGDLNRLADELGYDDVSPNRFDFVLDLGNYGDDLLEFIKDSYQCETLTSYLGI